ncbi:glycine--tRNA ligase, beta subunit [Selenomonas sp. oral taxon 137 str. F0430]|uniref:glycine--tRNA ligase subunit beta n=1 Tax=Selenomonas sp. oral taxon 137 TaxID=712531 RepID=UPI0001EB2E53|nr:glycine--tRNA ligase subunit beta [Selenomonas sp. oral taxon 137]EFR41028.1 glycine--tRNA ligase, beta subunit [Selenomonas sp. oral taxon 137 str. F0430]
MKRDLLLEIGTEEIPAHAMPNLLREMKRLAGEMFTEHRISYDEIRTLGTPRRMALIVTGAAERQADVSTETRGPAISIAFDADGNPTKAGAGFARGQHVAPEALIRRDGYVYAAVHETGAPTAEILKELLPALIRAIPLPNSMRWGDLDFRFIRPIRWIVALYGTDVVPFTLAEVTSGNRSRGHRTLAPEDFTITSAADYETACEAAYIIVDPVRRRAMISEQIADAAKACGGTAEITPDLLEEVLYLVEYPTALSGSFEEKYLALPAEAVITPMRDHQRYFPVKAADGSLLPVFITVRNGGREHLDVVAHGNERVLRARLADAQFFFDEDRKKSLAEHREKLHTVVFQQGLGSMYEKTERLARLAAAVVEDMTAGDDAAYETMAADARRAAELSKADLVTGMVTEFTELQGIMGREYALLDGEKPEVARAIDEQYMPRFAGDALPKSDLGFALSVADKIDNIVGTFSRGKIPTGSQDPFGLRRQALGFVNMLILHESGILLSDLVDEACDLYDLDDAARSKMQADVAEFIRLRLKNVLTERGVRYDVQEAVLSDVDAVADVPGRAAYVERLLEESDAAALVQSFVRVGNIARSAPTGAVDPALFAADEERALLAAYEAAAELRAAGGDTAETIAAERRLAVAIDAFFDAVMVMDKDARVKTNRLSLLKSIDDGLLEIADFRKIVLN